MASVIAFGETFLDLDCRSLNDITLNLGGACANLAADISLLGGKSAIITKITNDYIGRHLLSSLKGYGINTDGVRIVENDDIINTLNIIYSSASNIGYLTYDIFSVSECIQKKDVDLNLLNKYDIFHFGSKSVSSINSLLFCINESKKLGKKISYDVNYRDKIWKDNHSIINGIQKFVSISDFIKMNSYEASLFFKICKFRKIT